MAYLDFLKALEPRFGKQFPAGSVIFQEQEMGTEVYFIVSGEVRISISYQKADDPSGNIFHELAHLSEGDVFGEMAVLDAMPRSATVTAAEDTRVVVLNQTDFFECVRKFPDLAIKLLQVLGQRIRRADEKLKRALAYIAYR